MRPSRRKPSPAWEGRVREAAGPHLRVAGVGLARCKPYGTRFHLRQNVKAISEDRDWWTGRLG